LLGGGIEARLFGKPIYFSDILLKSYIDAYQAIEDYTSSVIQLSYVLLFGAVFPLAPLIVLLNSVVFMRVNAAKLLLTRKRPIAQKIGGLGVRNSVLLPFHTNPMAAICRFGRT
jgi:hypothetical protein